MKPRASDFPQQTFFALPRKVAVGENMIIRRYPEVGWVLTPEDIDLDRLRESMEMFADPLDRLADEILNAAKPKRA